MPPEKHALLGASSSARWLNCPPSARLTEGLQDSGSAYAAEGTLAHKIAEDYLRRFVNDESLYFNVGWCQDDPLFYPGMVDDVRPYVDYVTTRFNEEEAKSGAAFLEIEARLDFSEWVPEGFGTGDAIIMNDCLLEVIDLKFGKGVAVDATDNPQLKLYALGALEAYGYIYDIDTVRVTIVQPRLDHISSWECSVKDLVTWAEDVVKPAAEKAFAGKGRAKCGEWCRWCKIKATCKTRAAGMQKVADKRKKAELTDADIAEILAAASEIKSWLSDLEGEVLQRLLDGGELEGWKVVEGRSNRKIKDPDDLAEVLLRDYDSDRVFRPQELKTLTDLEKLVGKKAFAESYGQYIYKPEGKPTLAPDTDPRPVYHSAETEFSFE